MPMDYTFEMVFTGLCAFSFDEKGATVYLVNATRNGRFQKDKNLGKTQWPYPHLPRLSYLMNQQVRSGGKFRQPNQVFASAEGGENGICFVEGEELSLVLPGSAKWVPPNVASIPSISTLGAAPLSPLLQASLPNQAVTTRLRIESGEFSILTVARAGLQELQFDMRTIASASQTSGKASFTMADLLILRVPHLTDAMEVVSTSHETVRLRPDREEPDGVARTPVRVNLSNYHETYEPQRVIGYDFLWLYELLAFQGKKPNRKQLPIPVAINGTGGFTGSSGVCPPIRT